MILALLAVLIPSIDVADQLDVHVDARQLRHVIQMSGSLPAPTSSPGVETRLPVAAPPGGDHPVQRQAWQTLAALDRADEWPCMADIFQAESGWNPDGYGDRSIGGSVGLGQRHIPVWGDPRPWTVAEQVRWFTAYADDRYSGWCEARERWEARATHRDSDGRMVGGWW